MPYRSLADFVEELGQAGELVRVEAEVDPVLEVAEVTRQVATAGGPALLFAAVKGHHVPVVTNLLGTETRICKALGVVSLGDVAARLADLIASTRSDGVLDRLTGGPHAAALASMTPRQVRSGPCQQIVRLGRDVDLGALPALQSAPLESGPAITAAAVYTADPQSRQQVTGRYDLQMAGRDRLAIGWAAHDEHARLLTEFRQRSLPMPVAVVLGGDPVGLLAASAILPVNVDAAALAGLLRQKPLEVTSCRSVELLVPAEADFVIEGYVDPSEPLATIGPMCTPLGRYSLLRPMPVMHVTALTHRANPLFPAMVPGMPPHEASVVDRSVQRIFLPLVRRALPELVDYDLPAFGAARHWAALSIHKTYAGQARRAAMAAWGLRPLWFAKVLVVVDDQVDVHDPPQVLAAVAANVHPGRDVIIEQGPPDPLDPALPSGQLAHRMALDATAKWPEEHAGPWPSPALTSPEIRRLVSERWPQYGLGPP